MVARSTSGRVSAKNNSINTRYVLYTSVRISLSGVTAAEYEVSPPDGARPFSHWICFLARNRRIVEKCTIFDIDRKEGRGGSGLREMREKENNREKLERHYVYLLIAFATQSTGSGRY